jgi:SAM-dependent methyltransferase
MLDAMSAKPPEAAADVWGADRVYPDGSFMFQCHLFGYVDFAQRLPAGSLVLDLACGEGYGAAVLAARGHRTVALDLDPAMLAASARKYRAASFVSGDALRLPFADATFDGAGALQVIEHLPASATQPFVAEVARVLKPGAPLYCTTPNIAQLPATASKEFNPHHLRDFTPGELNAELSKFFASVELYGQVLDESLPRARRVIEGAQREWAVIGRVERVERAVRNLPGPLRVRLRRWLLRAAGIPAWPLPDVEAARNEIRAEDFRALPPADTSGNTIAIARR